MKKLPAQRANIHNSNLKTDKQNNAAVMIADVPVAFGDSTSRK